MRDDISKQSVDKARNTLSKLAWISTVLALDGAEPSVAEISNCLS